MSAVVDFLTQGAGMIVGFLVALVPLIILHELGHMLTAKAVGVWVREFGIGFPPRIVKLFRWQETDFTLNWLPLGGFAAMEGEAAMPAAAESTPEEQSPEQQAYEAEARKHSLYAQPPARRLPIFLSGPLMNILIAWVVAVAIYLPGLPVIDAMEVRVTGVAPNSPAELAGIQPGDVLVSIGGQPVETMDTVVNFTTEHLGVEIPLTVRRNGAEVEVRLTPRANPPEGEGAMGVALQGQVVAQHYEKIPFSQAVARGSGLFWESVKQLIRLPADLISGVLPWATARPIGIVNISRLSYETLQMSADAGTLLPILSLVMSVSLSLGIFNLLPVPALDGGYILFTLVEMISGKAMTPALQARLNYVALLLLLLIFAAVTVLDILYPVSLLTP